MGKFSPTKPKEMIRILITLLLLANVISLLGQVNSKVDTSEVYYIVEKMPTMKGNRSVLTGFSELFSNKFVYPDSLNCGIISTYYIEFTISKKGEVIDPVIRFRSNYKDCKKDYEKLKTAILEFLDKLPKFEPGEHNGIKVDVRLKFPVHIDLQ